ncbi:hypothetical protein KIN20_010394 [Parelaphostrongylus tenuis]|uniref:Uncharacterized protein n=1 Tax=Parelaphostrongylus tenuis TaxID=148309 RepID=A0AAD5M7T5_PARTN|nr:hypothetical protein KIN20_010394 [Parelaphostrongylus tenuis]
MYQHDTPSSYRQEDHYGNQTGPCSYDTYDTTPRFFGASPLRNLAASINRPTPGGMTMPHLVTPPQQHLADDKRATVPAKDGCHLPPHLSLPYGIPPAQLRGAPQQPTRQARSIDNSETSPSNSLTDQERYGGPALLQKENIRKPPESPRALIPRQIVGIAKMVDIPLHQHSRIGSKQSLPDLILLA